MTTLPATTRRPLRRASPEAVQAEVAWYYREAEAATGRHAQSYEPTTGAREPWKVDISAERLTATLKERAIDVLMRRLDPRHVSVLRARFSPHRDYDLVERDQEGRGRTGRRTTDEGSALTSGVLQHLGELAGVAARVYAAQTAPEGLAGQHAAGWLHLSERRLRRLCRLVEDRTKPRNEREQAKKTIGAVVVASNRIVGEALTAYGDTRHAAFCDGPCTGMSRRELEAIGWRALVWTMATGRDVKEEGSA